MKRRLAGHFFLALAILWAASLLLPISGAAATKYSVTLISDQMSVLGAGIKLNRFGHLVWEEEVYPNFSLWLYRGGIKTAIPCDATLNHGFLDMNNYDQVVWTQEWSFSPSVHYSDVYCYSGGSSGKITDASFDHINHYAPRINNLGTIIWYEWLGASGQVALRNSVGGISYAAAFVDGEHGTPRINDRDEVVWSGNEGTGNLQIYYWHGGTPVALTSDANYNKRPEINNRGDIVYAKTSASSPSGYDLYLYSGNAHTHTPIGSGVDSYLLYSLNDQGQVAWVAYPGFLYLYSGGSNTLIGQADWTQAPGLNNLGQVAYQGPSTYLRLYDQRNGSNFPVISGGGKSVQINDASQIAWFKATGDLIHNSVYLANPAANPAAVDLLLLD